MSTKIQQKWAKNLPEEEKVALLVARHERDREKAKLRARNNKVRTAAKKYGVTEQFLLTLIADRKGSCALCEKPLDDKLHIDHDHFTNKIRDILCGNCNQGLGHFKDSPQLLVKASEYLKKHNANSFVDED